MKILVYSDLHIELSPLTLPQQVWEQVDIVVLAGDIGTAKKAIQWVKENVPEDIPVLWIWGNHEYYGGHLASSRIKAVRALGEGSNIKILENNAIELNGIRFLGCTLWTDCRIHEDKISTSLVTQEIADRMNDYRRIRTGGSYRKLRVSETVCEHLTSVRWLRSELAEPFDGPTVVITHHAPLLECLNEVGDTLLDGAYASDLSEVVEEYRPNIWIYGHTHEKKDFMKGGTRLISNPRGYVSFGEETGFDETFIFEI
ncbi:metallophosphoesterase [Neptuniibacter sp. SY11_33]|uniref:metallophosphoesterase n=1 Tax=Neptuniibacter sp. SY11_33 TaxID=3398215 RepID=UPI0039F54930